MGTPALAVELAHEAARWLVDAEESLPAVIDDVFGPPAAGARRGRLVVADDNADMRDYLQRLLSPGWEVELAADGTAALEAALRARPDAILADVMMAGLDGFELVRRVREDPRLHSTPVVLLTARAGEDAVLQGLAAGASDYMTKPFAPRELVARVRAVVERSRVQEALRLSEEQFRAFVQASSELVYKMSADWSEMHYLQGKSFLADTERPSRSWLETYIPPEDQPEVLAVIREAIRTKSMFELEHRVICADGTVGWTRSRALPLLGEGGEIVEWLGAASDITYTRSEPRNPRAA